jgi:lipid II:glycine glycyltransferase (peptidoglycan interpeptide bridge formation enzyme)
MSQKSEHEYWKSFWQSPLWADILTKTRQAEIIISSHNTKQIIIERRKIWSHYTGLYILGMHPDLVTKEFLEDIQKNILTPTDLFLQIESASYARESREQETGNTAEYSDSHKNHPFYFFNSTFLIWKKAPFRRFIEPVTAMLNLKSPWSQEIVDEAALMASFAEKGRYNIRLAQKRGVATKWVGANEKMYNVQCTMTDWLKNPSLEIEDWRLNIDKTYIEAFYDLLDETTKRDGFAHNSLSYYQDFVETLESHNAGGLLVAEKDGVLHAAGIFVYTGSMPPWERGEEVENENGGFWKGGTAIYYYGASSSDPTIRRDMATYLLQWDAIREGIRRWCETYDFLGISEDGKGKLAGVTEFKLRFNPEKVRLPEEIVVVYRPFLLKILQIVSKARKLFR